MPLVPFAPNMWWNKRPAAKEVTIKARLKRGETLHITLHHEDEPRHLDIEGWGEVRLRIKSQDEVEAELRQT